jgi:hypothetical protein
VLRWATWDIAAVAVACEDSAACAKRQLKYKSRVSAEEEKLSVRSHGYIPIPASGPERSGKLSLTRTNHFSTSRSDAALSSLSRCTWLRQTLNGCVDKKVQMLATTSSLLTKIFSS